jgi:two-component system, cell cycle sensor histidine kinase and response regulator CckA
MREVSGKSAVFVREACQRLRLDYRAITADLSGLDNIDRARTRIDWVVFTELLDRVAQRAGGLSALEEVGTFTGDAPFAESIRIIAGAFASSRTLYYAIAKWFAPAAIRSIALGYEALPDGRVRIVVEVKSPHRVSLPFFYMTAGSYRAAPRLLGQTDAAIEMRVDGRRATYDISPPLDLTFWARGRRGLKVLLGARRALEELARQQEELRENYETLLATQRDFRRVIDSVPTNVMIHRMGRIVYANPAWNTTLGFDPTGRALEDIVLLHARDRLGPLLAPSPATGPALPQFEVPFTRAGGDVAVLELSPSQPVLFDGEAAAVLVGHDVTERRALEVKSQLADRMASIGTIAAGVAHEINNPLTYVVDNVRRLGAELDADSPSASRAELRQLVAEAVGGIERVELIVRDLHMFSRSEGDAESFVDLRALIESTARIAAKEVRGRAQLVIDLDAVPAAMALPTRLGQVLLNLVLNAAHAIPEGAPARHRIDIGVGADDATVVFDVRDTGSGIRPEHLSRIFEPFFTTKPPGRGTGLGLAVCHQIVTAMGGAIGVESELGRGTTVRVTLPIAAAHPPPVRCTSRPPRATPAPRKRVLVVDDEPLVARALQRALRAHEVTIALGGREALDVLRAVTFDVIVCDLMMPDMSGIDLYEQLPDEIRRRFVFATGGAFSPRAQQFLAEVPNRKIDKPFNARAVEKLVGDFSPAGAAR